VESGATGDAVFFNDRDLVDGRLFTVLYDIEAQKRIRVIRDENYSVGNSGVAPTGTHLCGQINSPWVSQFGSPIYDVNGSAEI